MFWQDLEETQLKQLKYVPEQRRNQTEYYSPGE